MPDPVRTGLPIASARLLLAEVTGASADKWLEACDATAAARLPLLMLAPIVAAFEQAMTEGEGKSTWRTDRYSPCPRQEAGRYLSFLASIGYQLSVIEQAVADDAPYTGDTPADPGLADPVSTGDAESPASADASVPSDGEPAESGGNPAPDGDQRSADDSGPAGDTSRADDARSSSDSPDEASPEAV